MALDFPNAPTNGLVYTSPTGEQWTYEAATNSWTSKGLVNNSGGLKYVGTIDITAAPPTGATGGAMYTVQADGTANAGFGPGITGALTKGDSILNTGAGWIKLSHPAAAWLRTGTSLAPTNTGDVVTVSAGTAALPGLTPVGDPNTGIYSPGADQLAISTGGTGRLFVDASGRVGIGTASPQEELHIAAASQPYILVESTGGVAGSAFYGYNSSTGSASIESTGSIRFAIPGSEAARIDSSGRLLVGTSTAFDGNTALQVKSPAASATMGVLDLQANYNSTIAEQSTGWIRFLDANGAYRARIACLSDGDSSSASDAPGRLAFFTTADGAATPTERMRIPSSGGALINATSRINDGWVTVQFDGATSKGLVLDDNNPGNTRQFVNFGINSGTSIGYIANSNNTGVTYSTTSDYRLKENIVPLIGAINRINQLQVHRFNFIAAPGTTVDGFLAHEAQAVVPECVTGEKDAVDDDGSPIYQGIDQSKLVPLLTAALQEAVAKIESLEARLTAAGI